MRILLLLLLAAPLLAQVPKDFDSTVARTMSTFDVPGIAVGVVKDGKLVFAKGYGVRRARTSDAVTPDTLFGIASNTKAFTAAALAMLVDEGKLSWDNRVVDRLPGFQMYDPYVTREMTIRDLLVHRSGLGLGAGDLLYWPPSTYTSDEIVSKLKFIKPATSFRSGYAYDNILYIVAGEVVEAVSGMSWDAFVDQRIFTPLSMQRSVAKASDVLADPNHAIPHAPVDGRAVALPIATNDNQGPAGGIHSSINELSRWVIAQLARGRIDDGRRLFSEKQSEEMWKPHVLLPISKKRKSLSATFPNFATYALGWFVTDYRGEKLVGHTGGLAGMVSKVILVPERNLGIMVFTNAELRGGYNVPVWTLIEAFLGAPKSDWVTNFRIAKEETEKEANEVLKASASSRAADSTPSLALAEYAGTYRDPWYGDVKVATENDNLVVRFSKTPGLVGMLEHWQYDTFIARWEDRSLNADAYMTFQLGPEGEVERVTMKPVSPLTDFSYDFQDLALERVEERHPGE